ncbi:MAG: pyrimidine reductase family protein, partial [Frankia sp.]
PRPGRHHVRVNFVTSADGAAELGGRSGSLGDDGDRAIFQHLRWLSDVVLVGAGTARAENYGAVKVPAERQALRREAGLAPVPPVAVVSGRLHLDPAARLFTSEGPRPLVVTCETAPVDRRAALAEVADVVVAGEDAVDARAAVQALVDLGLSRVLCEGGPSLHTDLTVAGLVDELCLTISPLVAGPGRMHITSGPQWTDTEQLRLAHVLEQGGTLFLRYGRP